MKSHQCKLVIMTLVILTSTAVSFAQPAQQAADPVERDIANLHAIHVKLTDGDNIREQIVKGWMRDPDTGYPDLVRVLLENVTCPSTGCHVSVLELLPLDVIEKWCKSNRPNHDAVIKDHDREEVRNAYVMTWHEKGGQGEKTLEQILAGQ